MPLTRDELIQENAKLKRQLEKTIEVLDLQGHCPAVAGLKDCRPELTKLMAVGCSLSCKDCWLQAIKEV